MISCTQFIPSYSELFRFLEDREGYDGVQKYWEYISDNYVEPRLGKCIRENGIRGCFEYWSHSLNEESADFTMTLDEEEGVFEIDMHDCPSKGRLNQISHIVPYEHYCRHCDILYRKVVESYGLDYEFECPEGRAKSCVLRVIDRKTKQPENGREEG